MESFGTSKLAFSMLELMVCIVAISIMAAALVPAITKKASDTEVRIDSTTLRPYCSAFGANCELCYEDRCVICALTSCPSGKSINVDKCACQ